MTFFAVVDEAGFERWLDACDDAFVDIGFTLFATGGLDIDVDELLPIDDGHAQFFLLRGIKQHAFHFMAPRPVRADVCSAWRKTPHCAAKSWDVCGERKPGGGVLP